MVATSSSTHQLQVEEKEMTVSMICDADVPTEFAVAKAQGYHPRGSGYGGVLKVLLEVLQSVECVTARH